jgi:hypothetical protein
MVKKLNGLIIVTFLYMLIPIQVFAGMSREYYPTADSDYFQKKFSYQLYISHEVEKLRMTQYKPDLPLTEENIVTIVTWNVKGNSYIWMDQQCKGALSFEYIDSSGKVVESHIRGKSNSYLNEGSCSAGNVVKPSDFNEDQNRYASDTFGGTKNTLSNPPTADGSGGTGETGFEGEDNGQDPGSGGTDPGGDPGSGTDSGSECSECKVFDCPGWDDYMGKLDGIKNSIPPAPNWDQVANKFRDSVVPKVISDLGDLLGTAPTPPAEPSQLPPVSDGGLSSKTPNMQDVPGLGEAGFNADDVKSQAPIIPVREDPTGGFDLLDNPMDTLPDAPTNPKPGQTDPGDWGKNKPKEQANPFPMPEDQGDPEVGDPPKPGNNGATPPTPGGNPGNAPIPGGDLGSSPTPGGEGVPGMKDYKPTPGSPDGSGGDIYP